MSLHLSQEEIIELTGYKRPSKQVEKLESLKVPFCLNAANRPIIKTQDYLTGKRTANTEKWKPRNERTAQNG